MGERGMGTVLELGSEGDLGAGDMVVLYGIYPSATYRKDFQKSSVPASDSVVLLSADVLVGCELPSFCR